MRCITTWTFKKEEPIELLSRTFDLEGTALLYSGSNLDSAQNSWLLLYPDEKISFLPGPNVWDRIKQKLGALDHAGNGLPEWVGFLGYELGCYSDGEVRIPHFECDLPSALFYRPTVIIHFNHQTGGASLFAKKPCLLGRKPQDEGKASLKLSYTSDTEVSYQEKIAHIKEWILDGMIYQVNLSQEFRLYGTPTPFNYFKKISSLNPAPFSAYLNCGTFTLVSSSPERFLKKEGNKLETRPIKGTRPRGKIVTQDARLKEELLKSEKERAELLMITDLMRNDLSKVSQPGSVSVKELWRCEAYTNVFHMLSVITSIALSNLHSIDLIKSLFPGGSITGCPKLKAMEAIHTFEKRPRDVYTGAIGYLASNGDFDFNIAIRTLTIKEGFVKIQLGGGIVMDSDPLAEYRETLHKGESLFKVLGAEELTLS